LRTSTDRQAQLHLQEILKTVRIEPWSWRRVKATFQPPEPPTRAEQEHQATTLPEPAETPCRPVKVSFEPIPCYSHNHEHRYIHKFIAETSTGELKFVLTGPEEVRAKGWNIGLLVRASNRGEPYKGHYWRLKKLYRLVKI
jgi:hypothetical protein